MPGLRTARATRIAVVVLLLMLGLVSSATAHGAEAAGGQSGGGGTIFTCQPPDTDNPGGGPVTASGVSKDQHSTASWPGLCMAGENSGGKSPEPVMPEGSCGTSSADTITIQGHRGIGGICP
jgi:hypothetical protein